MNKILFTCLATACLLTLSSMETVRADTVQLKSGRVYRNVKTVNRGDRLFIVFQSGRTLGISRNKIKSVKLRSVRWKRAIKADKIKSIVDEAVRNSVRDEVKKAFADRKREEEKKAREKKRKEQGLRRIHEKENVVLTSRRKAALWRSAILPGWGQYHSGRERYAAVFAAGGVLSFLYYWNQRSLFSSAQSSYNDSGLPAVLLNISGVGGLSNFLYFEGRRRNLEKAEQRTNQAFVLMAAVWGVNLWDAWSGVQIRARVQPTPTSVAPAIQLEFVRRF